MITEMFNQYFLMLRLSRVNAINGHVVNLSILTGASSNHFGALKHLLASIAFHESETETLVYDLGLAEHELAELIRGGWQIRRFDFENYPEHFQLNEYTGNLALRNFEAGHYAWKPTIIYRNLVEHGCVLWMDAGNLVHEPLHWIRSELQRCGFYSPVSDGDIARWTRPETLRYLNMPNDLIHERNRNAAVVGLNGDFSAVNGIAREWATAALDPECICPKGSSWYDNRCDQPILSCLVSMWRRESGVELRDDFLGVSVHNDQLSLGSAMDKAGVSKRRTVLQSLPLALGSV